MREMLEKAGILKPRLSPEERRGGEGGFVFEPIAEEAVPPFVREYMVRACKLRYGVKDVSVTLEGGAFLIRHNEQTRTYCLDVKIAYGEEVMTAAGKKQRTIERSRTLLIDAEGDRAIGWGEIEWGALNLPNASNVPSVGFTETDSRHKKRGLGERRLRMMNAYTTRTHHLPLHSGSAGGRQPNATRMWERLVEAGEAVQIEEERRQIRYAFKTPDT